MPTERAEHLPVCPVHKDPSATCICERLENIQIEIASRPSAAELIRRARQGGLIKAVHSYEGGDRVN